MSGKIIFPLQIEAKNNKAKKCFQCHTKSYLQSSQGLSGLNIKNKVILFLFWTTNRMHTDTKHTRIMPLFPRTKSPSESPACFGLGLAFVTRIYWGGKKPEKWKSKGSKDERLMFSNLEHNEFESHLPPFWHVESHFSILTSTSVSSLLTTARL